MTVSRDIEPNAQMVELLTRLVSKDDVDGLLAAFSRGELSEDRIVAELAARYQLGVGSAAQALAEHNKDAARRLGERLRSRIDEFLAGLAVRDASGAVPTLKPLLSESLKDREDSVILREYVIIRLLASRNDSVRSSEIFKTVRECIGSANDEVITAHLARMLKAGVIGKERKGRYSGVPKGATYFGLLASEIDARGLQVPPVHQRVGDSR